MDFATVKTANAQTFVYTPPPQAFDATRILVKPNLGYPQGPPVTVSMPVLGAVLRGLRRANPNARILIAEGACSAIPLREIFDKSGITAYLDDNMRLADLEDLQMGEYPNLLPHPVKYASMSAPVYIGEYDCCISVGTFKRTIVNDAPLISASLKNLYGVFPRALYAGNSPHARGQLHRPSVPEVLRDVYFCVGHRFHGAVVDLTHKLLSPNWRPDQGEAVPVGKVVWGDDLLDVDEAACRTAGEAVPEYITAIRQLRAALPTQQHNESSDAP